MFRSNKGYSLIEIGVGILILTVFLLVSLGMFNGAYNNYRRIKQRNIAVNAAIEQIENMLQMDTNELTGFFTRTQNPMTGKYELKPCNKLIEFVEENFDDENPEEYINNHLSACVNDFIRDRISNDDTRPTDEELANGEYAFIIEGNDSNKNEITIYSATTIDGVEYVVSNNQPMRITKTVRRLPGSDKYAYGNEVLKLKVEVFYSDKFGNNLKEEDLKSIVLETVKVTKTAK